MKWTLEQPDTDRDLINLIILLTIALCVGIYLIVTTTLIASDGVTFINYAMQLEIDPVKTMSIEYQHPGYPGLVLAAHKIAGILSVNPSVSRWIYCGQSVSLLFRLLAITVLYFIGKRLFGSRAGFWGIFILIVLPRPAEYGSDVLSDWPHLFFLSAGMLLLCKAAAGGRGWLYGFAGLFAGLGYLIRPECFQLIAAGILWLGLQLFRPRQAKNRGRVLTAFVLFILGFMAMTVPYMHLKGAVFPKKDISLFERPSPLQDLHAENNRIAPDAAGLSPFTPSNITKALGKLAANTCETLMWFFVPALLIGMCKWFKIQAHHGPDRFFIVVLVILNIPLMIWLYCKYGYMSDRHTLPLLIFPILFVPVGLQEMAAWLRERFSQNAGSSAAENHKHEFWFPGLLMTGILICIPRLVEPIRLEKQGFRAAATWLKANADIAATVAVPDKRISFYAERKGLVYDNDYIPDTAQYVVKVFRKQKAVPDPIHPSCTVEYEYIDKAKRGTNVVVYRN